MASLGKSYLDPVVTHARGFFFLGQLGILRNRQTAAPSLRRRSYQNETEYSD